MPTLSVIMMRLLLGLASFSLTLGSSIAAMQGGFDIGLADISRVPAVCWLMAFGTGCIGAINGKVTVRRNGEEQNA